MTQENWNLERRDSHALNKQRKIEIDTDIRKIRKKEDSQPSSGMTMQRPDLLKTGHAKYPGGPYLKQGIYRMTI